MPTSSPNSDGSLAAFANLLVANASPTQFGGQGSNLGYSAVADPNSQFVPMKPFHPMPANHKFLSDITGGRGPQVRRPQASLPLSARLPEFMQHGPVDPSLRPAALAHLLMLNDPSYGADAQDHVPLPFDFTPLTNSEVAQQSMPLGNISAAVHKPTVRPAAPNPLYGPLQYPQPQPLTPEQRALRSTDPRYVGSDAQAQDAATDYGRVAPPNSRRTSVESDVKNKVYKGFQTGVGSAALAAADAGTDGSFTANIPEEYKQRIAEALGTWLANFSGVGEDPTQTATTVATLGVGSALEPAVGRALGHLTNIIGEKFPGVADRTVSEPGLIGSSGDVFASPNPEPAIGQFNPMQAIKDHIRPRSFEHATDLVRGRSTERGWIFPGDGTDHFAIDQPDPFVAELPLDEVPDSKLEGGRAVHNHLNETYFSSDDVRAFANKKLFQNRVTTPQGRVFDMIGIRNHGFDADTMASALRLASKRAFGRLPEGTQLDDPRIAEYEYEELQKIMQDSKGPFSGKVWVDYHRR